MFHLRKQESDVRVDSIVPFIYLCFLFLHDTKSELRFRSFYKRKSRSLKLILCPLQRSIYVAPPLPFTLEDDGFGVASLA